MKKYIFITVLFVGTLFLTSCDKTDNIPDSGVVSKQAEEALAAKYPTATNVSWQTKGEYVVASFSLAEIPSRAVTSDHSAWFDNNGEWYMTEVDIRFETLPEEIKKAFQVGEYKNWNVDDVDKLEREGMETVYVIEVEGTENGRRVKYDLYYSPDGVLTKKVTDAYDDYDYSDYIPSKPVSGVDSFLRTNYPNARILDIDNENGMTEMEILDGRICRELLFDRGGNWLYTKTEVRHDEVPAAVLQALKESKYSTYRIDDIDHYKTPESEYYRFDLESKLGDVKVDITPEGVLTTVRPDDVQPGQDNGEMVDEAVAGFIAGKYPGAVIRGQDYDNGLLEVEIYHEKKKKDIYFNGKNEWVRTEWDVREDELPKAVKDAIAASEWASYLIDDIEYLQTSLGEYYLVELEKGEREVKLRIDVQGKILK